MTLRSIPLRSTMVLSGVLALPRRQVRQERTTRDITGAATETVDLVLGEESPLPDTDQDVADLVQHLRGHVMQLAVFALPGPVLDHAREVSATDIPDGYLPSRKYLRQLAIATQALVAAHSDGPRPEEREVPGSGRGRRWRPSKNAVRVAVFAVAVTLLIIAGSVPR
ncbi:DUF6415 family natural product biosynthesis protein [Streptomyces goshikiensis]|uniref:DUF6415 family natural product biosynthesis protein n=1 Tax=Streptomyces goshikiensis TaxID=1942 RepID=UPI0036670AEF